MGKTKISWATHSWNPITGCTKVSSGCAHCYAETMANRFKNLYPDGFGKVTLHPERLEQPLHWRKPARIFVPSMGDLFHDDVSTYFISAVWEIMERAHWHTFLVLTKRPERMYRWVDSHKSSGAPMLPNVWLGVSVENQQAADERIPLLLQVPAALHWVSYEPALGPVDLSRWLRRWDCACEWSVPASALGANPSGILVCPGCGASGGLQLSRNPSLGWLVCGGESGKGARPPHPQWFRDVRDQCVAAGVPFHFKQWGEYRPIIDEPLPKATKIAVVSPSGQRIPWYPMTADDRRSYHAMARVGKKAAGSVLDGREHKEYPQ